MTGISANNQGLQDSFRYTSAHSSTTTVVKQSPSNENTTLSVNLHTSSSYSHTRYTPSALATRNTYEAPVASENPDIDKLNASDNPQAESILALTFIEQRLSADLDEGASRDQLQSRLNAGYEGFMQGYTEAVSLLKSLGLFEGETKGAVEQMLEKAMLGFDALAETYELENPALQTPMTTANSTQSLSGEPSSRPPPPLAPQALLADFIRENAESSELAILKSLTDTNQGINAKISAETTSTRNYRFSLRTADGDTVNIQSFAAQSARYQSDDGASSSLESFNVSGLEDFSFGVQGELDAEELTAISDLLSQLNDVAELFFDGDVYSAYEQALEVGYDSSEIARFSLHLNQSEYTRIEKTYGTIANAGAEYRDAHHPAQHESTPALPQLENKVARLSEFMRLLEQILEQGERFEFYPEQMAEFTAFSSQTRFGNHPHFPQLAPTLQRMGEALQQRADH